MAARPDTTHRIDRRGTIVEVNAAWLEFARANRYPGDPGTAVGQSLWDHISDIETRHLYKELVARAGAIGPLRVAYRCDAPDLRRFMEMTIAFDAASDSTTFTSRILHTEERPRLPLLDPATEPAEGTLLRLCSWCKRGEYREEWIEIEQLVNRLRLFERDRLPRITHGICPECRDRVRRTGL